MSETAEASAPPLTEEHARAILRNVSSYLADNLDKRCRCNACNTCAATFLVHLQDRLTGPTIFINGWRRGMNKIGVGKLLHECGIPLVDSHRMTSKILESFRRDGEDSDVFDQGSPIRVQVAEGVDRDSLIAQLRSLGVMIE